MTHDMGCGVDAEPRFECDCRVENPAPTLGPVRKVSGIADQVAFRVEVSYPDELPSWVTFTGSVHGGPVVIVTPGNSRGQFVSAPERFGPFGPQWVRNFFA